MARQGPRPLALHLLTPLLAWLSSPAALPLLRSGSLPWSPELADRAAALRDRVHALDPEAFGRTVEVELRRSMDQLLTGLERYRHHPYRRALADPPEIWRRGSSRLLDYSVAGDADGVPVLFVPSLINRHYILDLGERNSLVRWLAGEGLRPYIVDWGWPGEEERAYSLTDYIAGRLDAALEALVSRLGRPVAVAGYCMGGLLAVALAARRPRDLTALALLATPWDFHAAGREVAERIAAVYRPWATALDAWGELPVDGLQALFATLDPLLTMRKFRRFAGFDPASEQACAFVALEDWLNDGVPLAAPVAAECLAGWYGRNEPAAGRWRVAGEPVEPGRLRLPVLAVIPERDRIVPPASAVALARAIPGAASLTPPLGHIGMVVGSSAAAAVWRPLARWLVEHG